MNENDKYIIKENYHGDIKLIKIDKPKVNLSKPTDILDHKVKQNLETLKVSSSNEKICLTKSEDLTKIDKHTVYQPNANTPLKYTIDKSETSIFNKMFSKLKVWFVAFALIISFVSLSVSLGSVLSYDILHGIMIFIITAIVLSLIVFVVISPVMFILSLVCLVKSIKNSNTSDIFKSVILLAVSFLGVYAILRGIII